MSISHKVDISLRFLKYWLNAVDDHSLHPPFAFRFYQKVIEPAKTHPSFQEIAAIRKRFLNTNRPIESSDPGAGSTVHQSSHRTVRQIALTSVSPTKISRLLYQCGLYLNARYLIELGTSLGITTRYLSALKSAREIHTLEGSEDVYHLALSHLSGLENVKAHLGSIDQLLPGILETLPQVDLAYLDANHTCDATIKYFGLISEKALPSSIIVVGDIHWSRGMEDAWMKLKSLEQVTLSIDLFHCGLLFFLPVREKQHYEIWF